MRHPVLECIPARAANHPPKQPATQEPAESQAASRAPSSAPGEAQHQQPQQEEQTTSTLNSPPFTRGVCAAAPRQATKATNQRSRNNYAGFRSRQSAALPSSKKRQAQACEGRAPGENRALARLRRLGTELQSGG